jgi:hypothetical protein
MSATGDIGFDCVCNLSDDQCLPHLKCQETLGNDPRCRCDTSFVSCNAANTKMCDPGAVTPPGPTPSPGPPSPGPPPPAPPPGPEHNRNKGKCTQPGNPCASGQYWCTEGISINQCNPDEDHFQNLPVSSCSSYCGPKD